MEKQNLELEKDASILIVGAGTFGCSTALHLARRGYIDITCMDKYPFPSCMSAGNDINKTVGCFEDIPGEVTSTRDRLKQEAIHLWNTDPVFKPFYHPVGMIVAANLDEPLKDTKRLSALREKNNLKPFRYLSKPDEFREIIPVLTGPLEGWRGYYYDEDTPKHGWVNACNAMESAAREAYKLGAKFINGENGEVVELSIDKRSGECIGVKTKNDQIHVADKIILCAGAGADLLLDFEGQLEAKCFTLAHIYIDPKEREKYKELPVIFNAEKGFFFEPDVNGEMKICNEFPGFTNIDKKAGISIPVKKNAIPKQSADEIREYLKETMPELVNKEFVKSKICWCTDSPDRQLILDFHPKYSNVILATGDSGRSFNLIPIIGKYIADLTTLGSEGLKMKDQEVWKWRPEKSKDRDNKQGRWGGSGKVDDLNDVKDWAS